MTTLTMTPSAADELTVRTRATWMAGDFGKIAKSYEAGAAEFIARLNFQPRARVLDVACGTGNLAIPAARSGAYVTGLDIAPNLIEQAQAWARTEDLAIRFEEGDAEQMPYADASFDAVVTMFGAMFAPRPNEVGTELVRVCRSGGRIAMANWTADGFIGQMFKIMTKHVPPAPGVPSPLQWGHEATVAERLGDQLTDLRCTRARSPSIFRLVQRRPWNTSAPTMAPPCAPLRSSVLTPRKHCVVSWCSFGRSTTAARTVSHRSIPPI
ncbi:MAG: methyltransferase domain-containing protein [Caldilineaceae bacterium]